MTEPTHHYRADVQVQLDYLMNVTRDQDSRVLEEEARESLRQALANAWTAGWVAAELPRAADAELDRNPYDETDKA
jgi:hypothetical protein